eukprot:1661255-Pyramimonas_sp.AAC.1
MQADSFGSAEFGKVEVIVPVGVGIYTYLSEGELFNTAFLNGEEVSATGSVVAVFSHGPDRFVPTPPAVRLAHFYAHEIAEVTVDWERYLDDAPVEQAYTISLNVSHARGTGDAPLEVSWGGFSTLAAVQVYVPSAGSVLIAMDDNELNAFRGHATSQTCDGARRYQMAALRASASFGGAGLYSAALDVTCYVTFESSHPNVAEVVPGSATLQGLAPGTTTISVAGGSPLITSMLAVYVSTEEVWVEKLRGALATGASWSGVPVEVLTQSPSDAFTATVTLDQRLELEGDTGAITFFANFSDGTVREVPASDGLDVYVLPEHAASIEMLPASMYDGRLAARVPFDALPGSGWMLAATWRDLCTGGAIADGVAP